MTQDRMFTPLAIAAMLCFAAPAAHAEYLMPAFEARIQAAAETSPAALSQLLQRTRTIYNVSMEEALRHVRPQPAASAGRNADE